MNPKFRLEDGSLVMLAQWMLKYWDVDAPTITEQAADGWTNRTGIAVPAELICG